MFFFPLNFIPFIYLFLTSCGIFIFVQSMVSLFCLSSPVARVSKVNLIKKCLEYSATYFFLDSLFKKRMPNVCFCKCVKKIRISEKSHIIGIVIIIIIIIIRIYFDLMHYMGDHPETWG